MNWLKVYFYSMREDLVNEPESLSWLLFGAVTAFIILGCISTLFG